MVGSLTVFILRNLVELLFNMIKFNLYEAVIEVSGHWLVKLPDRYSWWHKLLPLVMTGLHDELQEIREKAAEMWDAAGKLYMEENENDTKLKDKMDFLTENLEHYPANSMLFIINKYVHK